jgi:small subunit ribosomal protein S16
MPVKIRLSRKGRKKAPFYHIVVADARAPRDGKFIEKIGTYNPMTKPATIEIDRNAAYDWLVKGAQPTDTVKAILRFKGVYYKKHLMRGLRKGALTMEQVDTMWQQWIDNKENAIEQRRAQTQAEKDAFWKMVSGEAKAKAVVADDTSREAAEAFRETAADSEGTDAVAEEVNEVFEEASEMSSPAEAAAAEETGEISVDENTESSESTEESEKTEE